MKVLLVYPRTPDTFWSFRHVLRLVSKRASIPPLGLLTVAALLPRAWELRLIDLNVQRLGEDDLRWADYVLLSAMLVQRESVDQIAALCRGMGKRLIAGGPLFSAGPEAFPEIPHLVVGEAEDLLPQLVADMELGAVRRVYRAEGRPDITRVPVPRWDLIRLRHYATLAVQFSRGCPFDCEFCDIVALNGRVPRTKSPEQLVAELEDLRRRGWSDGVFVVDDNFIGNRRQTRALLRAMIEWRARTGAQMNFLTEASVNLADDAELTEMMVRAGFRKVFVGIESPSVESLAECHKTQNRGRDLVSAVKTLQRAGLEVMGGFIVGFDSDPADIFKQQLEFIQRSGVVTAMVGLLTALPQTRLYQRLRQEGRLLAGSSGNNTRAELNFRTRLNREDLLRGYRELMRKLYEPRTYYRRIRTFLQEYRSRGPRGRLSRSDLKAFLRSFWVLGVWHRGRRAFWRFFLGTLVRRPREFRAAMELAIIGYHFRRVARGL